MKINVAVLFNFLSAAGFISACLLLLRKSVWVRHKKEVVIPLLFSILLYGFIVTSNVLEHSGITDFLDPLEDIAEIIFILIFLLFVNNWRKDNSFHKIQNQESWLRLTVESIMDGILTTDSQGHILKMNYAMEKLTGWKLKEAEGKEADVILQFFDKATREPVEYNPFHNVLKDVAAPGHSQELFLKGKDGKYTVVTESTSLIINSERRVLGAVGIFRDMTWHESLLEQLSHRHKMEALGQLAGGVAHDLNNMLGGIMGASDIIRKRLEKKGDNSFSEMIAIIQDSAINARDLTANLLAFSRRGKILSSPVDLKDIILKTIALGERTIDKKISIESYFLSRDLIIIGDPSQLQNALLNLVINARDAMSQGGVITITAQREYYDETWCSNSPFTVYPGEYVRATVADEGKGISKEDQARIFEPFFTTKGEGEGTGLGLAAVYGTVASHQGALSLESSPGKGTAISLCFPATHHRQKDKESEKMPQPVDSGVVLIIDDEDLIRSSTRLLLVENDFTVYEASSGRKGIRLYKEKQDEIDIVLLDMIMPAMNGIDVLSELKKINPQCRVILISGFSRVENMPGDAAGFLKKPFNLNELLTALQNK
jgi:two-component system, cell cycle sensor histidine kinase and response regulator CckA